MAAKIHEGKINGNLTGGRRTPPEAASGSSTGRVVFAKIGWMKYYAGKTTDDQPIGGGKNNSMEIHNFQARKGQVLGGVHTGRKRRGQKDGLNLKRIDPKIDAAKHSLAGVLVVFLAPVPPKERARLGRGARVVGWYSDATVYDTAENPQRSNPGAYFNLCANEWTLVPCGDRQRRFELTGKGGMARTNIRYAYKGSGKVDCPSWMKEIQAYIQEYKKGITNELQEEKRLRQRVTGLKVEKGIENEFEREQRLYQRVPGLKVAIEKYAVNEAKRHYKSLGYEIKERGRPYDLLCTTKNERLFVEVKGTMGTGSIVSLSKNEVIQEFLQAGDGMELFVVFRIKRPKADSLDLSRGKIDIYRGWRAKDHDLTPIQYQCVLDRRRVGTSFSIFEDDGKHTTSKHSAAERS